MDSESDIAPPKLFNFRRVSSGVSEEADEVVVCRFMKLMAQDFETELRLPSFLFEDLSEEEIPPDVILISSLGIWAAELDKCCSDQKRVIGDAWEDYAYRHSLKFDNVIWFEQVGKMVFRTYVFDHDTCCEKTLILPEEQASKKRKVGACLCEAEGIFIAEMKESHGKNNYLNIPASFVKQHPIVKKRERGIVVNSHGDAWEMDIYYPGAKHDNFSYVQLRGWHAFARENNLEVGDACIFQFDCQSRLASSSSFVLNVEIRK